MSNTYDNQLLLKLIALTNLDFFMIHFKIKIKLICQKLKHSSGVHNQAHKVFKFRNQNNILNYKK